MPKRLLKVLNTLGAALMDFAFPPFCSLCRESLKDGERIVCEGCWSRMGRVAEPRCPRCGAPPAGEPCPNCSGKAFQFRGAFVLAPFDDGAQALIHLLKYREKTGLGVRLGRALGEAAGKDARMAGLDLLAPVPLHASRRRERGYNQSALIAKGAAEALGRPVDEGVLARRRATRTQTELSAGERVKNVSEAFAVRRPGAVAGLRVGVVDDVLTTGATINACASALLAAGAAEVLALAVASPFKE